MTDGPTVGAAVDAAVARARAVVGFYGDPTVSWSIGLDVSFTSAYDVSRLLERCATISADHPGLGRAPVPRPFGDVGAGGALRAALDTPYGATDPLLRVAHAADGRRLVVAAHHGAVDGLGLLAVLSLLIGAPVTSTARGIGDRASTVGFARSAMARVVEAVIRPPARLAAPTTRRPRPESPAGGDVTARRDLEPTRADTARTISAAAEALVDWNTSRGGHSGRLVAAVGASRRDGSTALPDRDTAYLRLQLPTPPGIDRVRHALETTAPEPTFPARPPSRAAGLVTAAMRSRLGSSFLVSNLGLVTAPPNIERIAFYPSAAGPQALAVGVASTPSYTTVTVRMPRADFDEQAADAVCGLVAERLQD